MPVKKLYLLATVSAYIWVLFEIYNRYLFTVFEYAHFAHVARSPEQFALSVLLCFGPLVADAEGKSFGKMFSAIIYALYYLPAIIITFYSIEKPYQDVLLLQCLLCASMISIFWAGSRYSWTLPEKPISKPARQIFSWITLALVVITVAAYGGHMRLVSFADVYDLRADNADLVNPIIGYFVMWLSYGLLPFVLACGLLYKEVQRFLIGLLGCVVIYGATGAKAAILTPVFVFALYFLAKRKGDLLPNLLAAITLVCFAFIEFAPDDGVFGLVKAVLFMRTIATPGWALSIYYQFFAVHPLTYLSQIGAINALTHAYPYGSYQLGQILGIEISGTTESNFNTGFWATEGLASFWLVGILIAGGMVAAFLLLLNRFTRGYNRAFLQVWACGFAMSLLNLPFFTALLSGGGLLMLLMALNFSFRISQKLQRSEKVLSI